MGKVYGNPIYTADISNKATYQRFKLPSDFLLLSVRMGMIYYNSPVFTDLKLSLYSDNSQSLPGGLIAESSNSVTSSDVSTLAYADKEIYFEWNTPHGIHLQGEQWYHLVLSSASYVGNENSHIALKKSWPSHPHENFTPTLENLAVAPWEFSFIGAQA